MASQEPPEGRTVGPRDGLAAGIIGLGILAIVLPTVVDQLPSAADGGNPAFVLSGMMVMIGAFVVAAGVLSFFIKD
jgi:hypothetical protein